MSANAAAGDIAATWQGLARLPQMLTEVRGGVLAAKALISTPPAAMATGSLAAGAAVWALGAELGIFIAQTVQALDDDIDGLRETLANYQRTDDQLTAEAGRGVATIERLAALDRPSSSRVAAR
ncbi:MAG: hypothetical protein ACK5OX_05925 [Desertimonas sp.]